MFDFHSHLRRDPITKEYEIEALLADMEANKIDCRMISTVEGKSTSAQNDMIIDLVKQYPDKLVGCAVINQKEDDSVEEMKRVCMHKEIKAIELDSMEHGYLPEKLEYNINPILEIADENNIIVKLFTGWGARTAPQQWKKYVEKFPNVKFVILHIGGIDFGYGSIDFAKQYDNVYFETSNQTEIQILHRAFNELPFERFVFGSNYPEQFTYCSIHTFDCLDFTEEQKEDLYQKNAEKLLGING